MNRYAKGAIAAGAGVVLLLGGAGTFALWNDSTDVDAGSVASGQLALSDPDGGHWFRYDGTSDPTHYVAADGSAVLPTIDPSSYTIVPNDKFIFVSRGIDLTAKGGDLYFTVSTSLDGAKYLYAGGLSDDATAYNSGNGYKFTTAWTPSSNISAVDAITADASTDPFLGEDEGDLSDDQAVADGTTVYHVSGTGTTTITYDASILVEFDADDAQLQNTTLDLSTAAIDVTQVVPAS